MSENITVTGSPTSYKAHLSDHDSSRRIMAVQTAVELIHAHASSGCVPSTFQDHIKSVGEYADAIEAALQKTG